MKPIYRKGRPDKVWYITEIFKVTGLCLFATYLFFDSLIFMPLTLMLCPFIWKLDRGNYNKRLKQKMRFEFKDVIVILAGNLNVGYSLENAFVKTEHELVKLYGNKSLLATELHIISNGLNYNRSLEDMLLELGKRSDIEEITECGELLVTCKQYGGNMINVIHQIADNLSERFCVELEIDTSISAKKLESKIMLSMPFLIIAYMRIVNGSYLDMLYDSISGRIVMIAALVVVAIAAMWSNRIVRIEV